jgi:ADP-heptose:LPS heptosyltransferase
MKNRSGSLVKFIDRYLGSFLIYCLGFFKVKQTIPKEIRSIALLKPNALGDTTLVTAVASDLRESFPMARIIFFIGESNSSLAHNIEGVDEIISLPIKNPLKSLTLIRHYDFDLFFDFGSWPRINSLLTCLSKAKHTIGFKTQSQNRHYAYDTAVVHCGKSHELENYRNLIRHIGLKAKNPPRLILKSPQPQSLSGSRYIIFHLWPSGHMSHLREWPRESWIELINRVDAKTILLTGAPAESKLNQEFLESFHSEKMIINIAGEYSLSKTLTIISNSQAIVSVNTGIMHIAAALGTPTIGLSGPTNDKRWGPLGNKVYSVTPKVEGCGFLNLGFEYSGQRIDCMQHISVDQVLEPLNHYLENFQKNSDKTF